MSAAAQPPNTAANTGATAGWLCSAALAGSRSSIGSSAQRASNAAPIKCAARSASPNARQAATCRIALQAVDVLHARQASITARAASRWPQRASAYDSTEAGGVDALGLRELGQALVDERR